MVCKRDGSDRLLQELVKKGINVVLPPREGIEPGDLIVAETSGAVRTASWSVVLGIDPPRQTEEGISVESHSFAMSDAMKVATGASLVGRILSGLGVGSGKLEGALHRAGAAKLNLMLTAPAARRLVNFDDVLDHIRTTKASPRPGYEKFRLLIVERAWRARGMSIELMDARDAHVAVSADLTNELQAEAKLTVSNRGDGRITFVAAEPLVFGVALRELFIQRGNVTDGAPKTHYEFRASGEDEGATLSSDLFVDLEEGDLKT